MKKINYIVLFIFATFFYSCKEDETEIFEKAPAERILERNSELFSLLTSEEQGFKASCFTKNDEFGGFTFFMKFNTDGTVEMTSDFDSETDIVVSDYEVTHGTTTEIVFSTRTHIHKVSNPSHPGLIGSGYKGTSVFQYFGLEGNTLEFRDIRNPDTGFLKLTPTGFTDFETESVQTAIINLSQETNILPLPTSPVFQVLEIENQQGTSKFNFNYDELRNFVNALITLDDGTVTEFNFGVLFDEGKLIASPALEFEGKSYEEFLFEPGNRSYVSTVNGTTASIIFDNEPAFLTKDYESIIGQPETFLYRPNLGANALTSAGHDIMIENINASIAGFGLEVYQYIVFTDFLNEGDCSTALWIDFAVIGGASTAVRVGYCFQKGEIIDRKMFFGYTGVDNSFANSAFLESRVQPLIDFFGSSTGMVFTREGSFSSSGGNFSNRSATFTSIDNPSLRVYGLFF